MGRFSGGDLRDGRLDRALRAVACSELRTRLLSEGGAGKLLHRLGVVDFSLTGDGERDGNVGRLTADRVIGVQHGMTLRRTCQLFVRAYLSL